MKKILCTVPGVLLEVGKEFNQIKIEEKGDITSQVFLLYCRNFVPTKPEEMRDLAHLEANCQTSDINKRYDFTRVILV